MHLIILLSFIFVVSTGILIKNRIEFPSYLGDSNESLNISSFAKNVTISGVKQIIYSGYLNVNKTKSNSSLYFLFYGCPQANSHEELSSFPIIIWLNGGPGASSVLSAFYEHGPYTLIYNATSNSAEEFPRNVSWNDNYSLLYIDQPIGTGLSYAQNISELASNEKQIDEHFFNALQEFYSLDAFRNLANTPLYMFGYSYAGKYVPTITHKILVENKHRKPGKIEIPIKGVGFGNGFTHPSKIIPETSMFLYNLGAIDFRERQIFERKYLNILLLIKKENWSEAAQECLDFMQYEQPKYFNDSWLHEDTQPPYNNSLIIDFFLNPLTQNRYNILNMQNGAMVEKALLGDLLKSSVHSVEYLLDYGLPVLIYNGQDDSTVSNPGAMRWIEELNWNGAQEFNKLDLVLWKDNNGIARGYKKKYQNFEFGIINNASHSAVYDQPESTKEIVYEFLKNIQ